MSFNVAQYPQVPYRRTPVGWPVKLFQPSNMRPTSVQLLFDWSIYFAQVSAVLGSDQANLAVAVDVNQNGSSQGAVLDKIVTCKIDNSNSLISVLVYFPDSGDVIACPPQTIATFPCNTNGSACKIIAQGLTANFLPQTTVTFYNYFVPPSSEPQIQIDYPQWAGTPNIQRGSLVTPGFASPALGDQIKQWTLDLATPGAVTPVLDSPQPSGVFILTTVFFGLVVTSGNGGNAALTFLMESTGASGTLFSFPYVVNVIPNTQVGTIPIYQMSGLQTRLNATETWRLRNVNNVQSGVQPRMIASLSWSYLPNG